MLVASWPRPARLLRLLTETPSARTPPAVCGERSLLLVFQPGVSQAPASVRPGRPVSQGASGGIRCRKMKKRDQPLCRQHRLLRGVEILGGGAIDLRRWNADDRADIG